MEPTVVEKIGVQTIVEDRGRYYLWTQGPLTGSVGFYWAFDLTLEAARRLAEQFRDGYLKRSEAAATE